jgi:hypothetical protein
MNSLGATLISPDFDGQSISHKIVLQPVGAIPSTVFYMPRVYINLYVCPFFIREYSSTTSAVYFLLDDQLAPSAGLRGKRFTGGYYRSTGLRSSRIST